MIGSLAMKFVSVEDYTYIGPNKFYFQNLDILIKFMKKFEDKFIRQNGFLFLAKIFEKLDLKIGSHYFIRGRTIQFISKFIADETNIENLTNPLKCLHLFYKARSSDLLIIKNSGCLTKLLYLLRYSFFRKNICIY